MKDSSCFSFGAKRSRVFAIPNAKTGALGQEVVMNAVNYEPDVTNKYVFTYKV